MNIISITSENNLVVDMTLTRVAMSVNSKKDNTTSSYDSEKPNEGAQDLKERIGENIDETLNKPIEILFNEKGKILSNIAESKTGFIKMMLATNEGYPKEAVGIGDQWTEEVNDSQNGIAVKAITTYTVGSITSKDITLKVSTKMGMGTAPKEENGRGNIVIDLTTGDVKKSEIDVDMVLPMGDIKMIMGITTKTILK